MRLKLFRKKKRRRDHGAQIRIPTTDPPPLAVIYLFISLLQYDMSKSNIIFNILFSYWRCSVYLVYLENALAGPNKGSTIITEGDCLGNSALESTGNAGQQQQKPQTAGRHTHLTSAERPAFLGDMDGYYSAKKLWRIQMRVPRS